MLLYISYVLYAKKGGGDGMILILIVVFDCNNAILVPLSSYNIHKIQGG